MCNEVKIKVIGAGLAGCEAAYAAARLGVKVELHEMKPHKHSPAHHTDGFAELVCSNSLRSNDVTNAVGLLKAELSALGSLVMEAAYATEVPAGSALAVNRELFSEYMKKNDLKFGDLFTDGVHPNDKGYDIVFELLLGELGI